MIDADSGWTFVPTTDELERLAKLPDCRLELPERLPAIRVATLIEVAFLTTLSLLVMIGAMFMRGCF